MKAIVVVAGVAILLLSLSYFAEAHPLEKNVVKINVYSKFYSHYLEKLNKKLPLHSFPVKKENIHLHKEIKYGNEAFYEKKETNKQSKPIYNWTFMIYMDGDNNLAYYAEKKAKELLTVRKKGIAIVVLYDGNEKNDSCLYVITNNTKKIDKGELNMGDGKTLRDFITFAKNYSARHYILEIWGHGDGWMGAAFDQNNKDYLSLQEIKNALSNESVDIMMFSACYTGGIEVAYELRNEVKYFVAPETFMLATGLPWRDIFSKVNSSINDEDMAKLIVEEYGKYYAYTSTTYAAWNESRIESIIFSIQNLSVKLDNMNNSVEKARNNSCINEKYVDLYSFAEFVGEKGVTNSINYSIVSKFGKLHGISIYFPLPLYYSSKYQSLDFSKEARWEEIIKS